MLDLSRGPASCLKVLSYERQTVPRPILARPLITDTHTLQVLVDINWRPVFWEDESSASAAIKPYACKADIVKMSDEEAEWLFGIPAQEALHHPLKVRPRP